MKKLFFAIALFVCGANATSLTASINRAVNHSLIEKEIKQLDTVKSIDSPQYSYDSNHVRYELYSTNESENYNWLFFPGGPGGDYSYFRSLVDILSLPGNVWLIDMPGNGSNVKEGVSKLSVMPNQ